MENRTVVTWDGNEAVASVAYRVSEVIAIYPITPASPMGEHADAWSARELPNIWGDVPQVVEMQSEGGAAAACHGAAQAGSLTTTFTASQGLLLMIPNMYKIAGELNPAVIHVTARSLATHALSIFCDHGDIYAVRQTGWTLLGSNSVQEAHDMALIAHAATLRTRIPILHFFDGFRTSHEVSKSEKMTDDDIRALIDENAIREHRARALSPDHPVLRGTAQNPDVHFQAREAANLYYQAAPAIIQTVMDEFAARVGRQYHLYDYVGHPEAERVMILMGSAAETAHETVEYLVARGEKVGLLKVHLFRPFSATHFLRALPKTAKSIVVLDRAKEPGSAGEPLYLDVLCTLNEARAAGTSPFAREPVVVGGRYGLSSKEFTPAMAAGVFSALQKTPPPNHFTIGIQDDVSHLSLPYDPDFTTEADDVKRALFFGLGADGTVGANKNTIKIIGEETPNAAQGYFVYDSKKSGTLTVSHLRFGPRHIRATYLVDKAQFVACHQWVFLEKYEMLQQAVPGATFLLNAPYGPDEVWDKLPIEVQSQILEKKLKFYVIDAYDIARKAGMPGRINTIMQTCYFAVSGVLPRDEAIEQIKKAIKKTYGSKGETVVKANFLVVDNTVENLHEVRYPQKVTSKKHRPPVVPTAAPEYVKTVTAKMLEGKGDLLPVSAFAPDGTFPTATTQWEKRCVAEQIPQWNPEFCIQCNKCAIVCPHAAIRPKVFSPDLLQSAPAGFRHTTWKGGEFKGQAYTVQVAPDDCTGCGLCARNCPGKDKKAPENKALTMTPILDVLETERASFSFFLGIPDVERTKLKRNVKESQLLRPLFEFSGACPGCGETPYVKLLSQLFGDRLLIGNATGCSSIYGGNLPTTPYAKDDNGRGPAWSNSLFEDNAEFGMGFRFAVDQLADKARMLVKRNSGLLGDELAGALLASTCQDEVEIEAQRERVKALRAKLAGVDTLDALSLRDIADYLVKKSVWVLGGDGWAYDIGFGGLDHLFASRFDVNVLVMDTEVYSNTGGQASKSTPRGAVARFAAGGKPTGKKDLGFIAMSYGGCYVAQIALGAKDTQTVRAFLEAESYQGPSLIIAYSHCINHGFDLNNGLDQQERAVDSGHWPLYRFDPRLVAQGKSPLQLDSGAPSMDLKDYAYNENRYKQLLKAHPEAAAKLMEEAQKDVRRRFALYTALSRIYGEDAAAVASAAASAEPASPSGK